MNRRVWLATMCERTGATAAAFALRRRAQAVRMPVLTFHRVQAARRDYPFDDGVIDATPEGFERQVATIAKYFTPVGVDDVVHFLDGAPLAKHPILVTFDDGYRDNYEVALPILQRHGVRAVFFIATEYIARRRLFWWDRIAYLVKKSSRRVLALAYPYRHELQLGGAAAEASAIEILLRLVKSVVGLDLERFLGELAGACDVTLGAAEERALADEQLMTWDHVRALRAAGMDVQSHTRTHRVLQTLAPRDLAVELAGSRQDLERELGHHVCAISYPVGHMLGELDPIRKVLADSGYKLGFTNVTGTMSLRGKLDRYGVSRIAFDQHTPDALFRAMLALPGVFEYPPRAHAKALASRSAAGTDR